MFVKSPPHLKFQISKYSIRKAKYNIFRKRRLVNLFGTKFSLICNPSVNQHKPKQLLSYHSYHRIPYWYINLWSIKKRFVGISKFCQNIGMSISGISKQNHAVANCSSSCSYAERLQNRVKFGAKIALRDLSLLLLRYKLDLWRYDA